MDLLELFAPCRVCHGALVLQRSIHNCVRRGAHDADPDDPLRAFKCHDPHIHVRRGGVGFVSRSLMWRIIARSSACNYKTDDRPLNTKIMLPLHALETTINEDEQRNWSLSQR